MKKTKKILMSLLAVIVLIFLVWFLVINKDWMSSNNEGDDLLKRNQDIINLSSGEVIEVRGVDKSDVVIGKSGQLEIIVYEDLADLYSVKLDKTLKAVKENFSDEVVIAFRPYVNKMFALSYPAYSLAECAKEQGKFFEARELILEKVAEDNLIEDSFLDYGQVLGLNEDSLNQCLLKDKYIDRIDELSKEAEFFGVYGSPTIFIGEETIIGARDFEDVVNGGGEKLLGMKNIINNKLGYNKVIEEVSDNLVVCTMDAKMCSDGSFVGRDSTNNCEFFPCPEENK